MSLSIPGMLVHGRGVLALGSMLCLRKITWCKFHIRTFATPDPLMGVHRNMTFLNEQTAKFLNKVSRLLSYTTLRHLDRQLPMNINST